uniref:Uncharacterized protein n=1 Tax=Hibiscus soymovirus TaxID=3023608 RepID=A0AAF0Z362_9VIRU|nr:hypothetical protein [Hibiscus soymovirus]WPF45122.1 hypothetical protein [Hibiscus soymovirus]
MDRFKLLEEILRTGFIYIKHVKKEDLEWISFQLRYRFKMYQENDKVFLVKIPSRL